MTCDVAFLQDSAAAGRQSSNPALARAAMMFRDVSGLRFPSAATHAPTTYEGTNAQVILDPPTAPPVRHDGCPLRGPVRSGGGYARAHDIGNMEWKADHLSFRRGRSHGSFDRH